MRSCESLRKLKVGVREWELRENLGEGSFLTKLLHISLEFFNGHKENAEIEGLFGGTKGSIVVVLERNWFQLSASNCFKGTVCVFVFVCVCVKPTINPP